MLTLVRRWSHPDISTLTADQLNKQLDLVGPSTSDPSERADFLRRWRRLSRRFSASFLVSSDLSVLPSCGSPSPPDPSSQPYGSYNAENLDVLASRGYYTTLWNFDNGDTEGISSAASIARYAAIYNNYPAPFMALNHGSSPTCPFFELC